MKRSKLNKMADKLNTEFAAAMELVRREANGGG